MTALQESLQVAGTTARARFRVELHCWRCALTLEQALSTTDGVRFARVHPVSGDTTLGYDAAFLTPLDLQQAIEAAGFNVGPLPTASA